MSQDEFASGLGISNTAISRMENRWLAVSDEVAVSAEIFIREVMEKRQRLLSEYVDSRRLEDDPSEQERGALRRALSKAGKIGGKKRWAGRNREERSRAASEAANARWGNVKAFRVHSAPESIRSLLSKRST